MAAPVYRFGPYEFQASNGDLRKHGQRIKLQPKPQQILRALLEKSGETITREELQARLWPEDTFVDFDQGLNVAVKKLRDALNDSTNMPRYIETVPGVGYRFIGVLQTAVPSAAPLQPESGNPGEGTGQVPPEVGIGHKAHLQAQHPSASAVPPSHLASSPVQQQPAKSRTLVLAVAACLSLAVVIVSAFAMMRPRVKTQTTRLSLTLPGDLKLLSVGDASGLALSPDATRVVFPALRSDGKTELWMRRMDTLVPEALPGTEGGMFPFWSPDGQSIGFFTETSLKRLNSRDGVVREICPAESGRGAAWTEQGLILFAPGTRTPLYKVPAEGGVPVPITKLDEKRHTTHRWPALLPDGSHFIFLAASHELPDVPAEIYLGSLDGSQSERIMDADSNAVVISDKLIFVSNGKLISRSLDAKHHRADTGASILAEGVAYDRGSWHGNFAAAGESLVYLPQSSPATQVIARFDRQGRRLGDITKPGIYHTVNLSPDGQMIAAACGDPDMGVCLMERDGTTTHLPGTIVSYVEWSPDSASVAYDVHRQSKSEIRIKEVGKNFLERTIPSSNLSVGVGSWDPDGKHLLVATDDRKVDVIDLGNRERRSYLPATPGLYHARISPNGKWVAYESNRTGTSEVYLASYPLASVKYQVSASGGVGPRWRGDSRELYFLGPRETLFAVSLAQVGNGLQIGQPRSLFHPPILSPPRDRDCCDVSRDGAEFFVVTRTQPEPSELVVISHWAR